MQWNRREFLKAGIGVGASILVPPTLARADSLIQRKIPSSGESLPVVGIGTARRYEAVTTEAERAPLREVLRRFAEMGGKVIDTAPSYGTAESVVGDLVAGLKSREALFIATKLGTYGRDAG